MLSTLNPHVPHQARLFVFRQHLFFPKILKTDDNPTISLQNVIPPRTRQSSTDAAAYFYLTLDLDQALLVIPPPRPVEAGEAIIAPVQHVR